MTTVTQRPTESVAAEPAPRQRKRLRGGVLILGLGIALVAVCIAAAGIGAHHIAPDEVLGSILHRLGIGLGPVPDELGENVLDTRLPRVVLGILVGASLGCAGALMQGVFGNPLAEPAVIGVSWGAAVGAACVIVFGFSVLGNWTLTAAAFFGGLITVLIVYLMSRSGGRTEVVTLVLTGIAINALAGALIGLLMFYSNDAQLRAISFWMLGSIGSATWPAVAAVAPCALVGLLVAPLYARKLDLLALGERPARHLGVNVERLRLVLVLVVALLTSAAVAFSGVISFVGLIVPHAIRMAVGPGHRLLLVGSTLGGAMLLVGADLVARTVAAPAEVPLGALTALLGSPLFFWLLRRTRARQGGWA